jgi:hypothetical protein
MEQTNRRCALHPEHGWSTCPICYEAFLIELLDQPREDEEDEGVDVPVPDPPEFCELHPRERWAECPTCRDASIAEDMESP